MRVDSSIKTIQSKPENAIPASIDSQEASTVNHRSTAFTLAVPESIIRDSATDFPNLSDVQDKYRRINPHQYYQLPNSPVQISNTDIRELKLIETKRKFPLAQFTQPLRTRRIFRDSERFYGIDLTALNKENLPVIKEKANNQNPSLSPRTRFRRASSRVANKKFLENHSYPIRRNSHELVKKFFKLDKNDSLKPRSSGLKLALKIYLDQLKTFQPYLYEICLRSACKINEQNPETANPEALCTISVHQSETNLPNLLQQLAAQDFDKKKCPIYLFVNGNDQSIIDTRLEEIEKFKKTNSELDIRVIAAKLDDWRYGLKCIPLITAFMSLALRPSWDSDQDLATIFFDADIIRFSSQSILESHSQAIKSGKLVSQGGASYDLTEHDNVNYQFLNLLETELEKFEHCYQILDPDEILENSINESIHCSGGNSAASTLMLLLGCATAAHSCNEDLDLSERCSSNIIRAFEKRIRKINLPDFGDGKLLRTESDDSMLKTMATLLINLRLDILRRGFYSPPSEAKEAYYDLGVLERVAKTCRPINERWDNHDDIQGQLSPIDLSQPQELCFVRVEEELSNVANIVFKLYKEDLEKLQDAHEISYLRKFYGKHLMEMLDNLSSFLAKFNRLVFLNLDFDNGFKFLLVY